MTAHIFKSMTPDRDSRKQGPRPDEAWLVQRSRVVAKIVGLEVPADVDSAVRCDRCGSLYFAGDWPWCTNGDPTTHRRG